MKIECEQSKIFGAISRTERATHKNHSLAVLSGILCVAEDNAVTLKATNLDLGIEITVPVKVHKPGSVVIPSGILKTFISGIPADTNIIFEQKEDKLVIIGGGSRTELNTLPKDEFPSIPKTKNGQKIETLGKKIAEGLRSVSYAAAQTAMKPELSSVLMACEDSYIVFVATDSFRLAEKKIKTENIQDFENILIPARNTLEIQKNLEEMDDQIIISMGEEQISFEDENTYITSRIVDGVFPDYKQIIPEKFVCEATFLSKEFFETIRTATIFSDKFNKLTLSTDSQKQTLLVYTKNNDVGEHTKEIEGQVTGGSVSIGFNYRYIQDVAPHIYGDSIHLSFSGQGKPMLISDAGTKTFSYIVMPLSK